tara:strand:- start:2183 stop:2590 length:408 start_codon:yes stop_codon:yes gene_type:complete
MPRIYLSLSYAIRNYGTIKDKLQHCDWVVSNTKHHSVEDMFDCYNTRAFRPKNMGDTEFVSMLEALWAKLVQPRIIEGPLCGHFAGYSGSIEVPPGVDVSTPAAAIQALRDWQMLNGWYEDMNGTCHSMHDKDSE